MLFHALVDSADLHRSLELPPRVISRHKMMDKVVKLVVYTIYSYDSYDNISLKTCLATKKVLVMIETGLLLIILQ